MPGWEDRTVLITGYAGFLGGWLAGALLDRSARVLGLVNGRATPIVGPREGQVETVAGDIRDGAALRALFERHPVDVVFHLASLTLPTLARQAPHLAFEINARGAWNLLEAMRTAGSRARVVFSSTDSVYGENDGTPFVEDSSLDPDYPYEASKACAEIAARCYHRTYGLPIALARFCNLYGPGDIAESRLMAGTIETVLAGRRPRLRGDGKALRNYLYVEDAVAALLTLAEALERPGIAGEAFNFCDETPLSVLDVVTRVLDAAGRRDLEPELGSGTPGEISVKRASAAKARRALGWGPRVTLDEGLRRTVAWHRERPAQRQAEQAG